MVRSHAPSRHTLTVLSLDTVMMRPSGTDRRHAFHHVRMLEAHAAVRLLGGRRGVAERAAGALDALDVADEAELRQHQAEDLGWQRRDRHICGNAKKTAKAVNVTTCTIVVSSR